MKTQVTELFSDLGVVPVAVIDSSVHAISTARALQNGGLPCVEVTFRTDAAEDSIRLINEHCPLITVGAGTVLTVNQADRAVCAGAKFIVSPGFDEDLVDYCNSKNVLCIPGCSTATEIMQAIKKGLSIVKFFPAIQLGGVSTINALAAPFSNIKFMPSGGINESNFGEYISSKNVIACGGSWMIKKELIQKEEFDRITKLTQNACKIYREVRDRT